MTRGLMMTWPEDKFLLQTHFVEKKKHISKCWFVHSIISFIPYLFLIFLYSLNNNDCEWCPSYNFMFNHKVQILSKIHIVIATYIRRYFSNLSKGGKIQFKGPAKALRIKPWPKNLSWGIIQQFQAKCFFRRS